MYNSQKKHKAKHGGYRQRPTRQAVAAQMQMYAAIAETTKTAPAKEQSGAQLKLKF